jgi:hypothetical protein
MPKDFQPLKPDDLCRLIDAHGATLILYAKQWNADDAEDVVQETLLRLVRRAQWEGKTTAKARTPKSIGAACLVGNTTRHCAPVRGIAKIPRHVAIGTTGNRDCPDMGRTYV